jgi:hypothetical protein
MPLPNLRDIAFEDAKRITKDKNKELYESLVIQYTNPQHEWGKNNIRDLIVLYHQSGLNREKIYNILYNMGVEKDVAYNAIETYLPQNNNIKMNVDEKLDFTSNVRSLIDSMNSLRTADSVNYNIDGVVATCESYININKQNMTVSDFAGTAKRLVGNLNQYDYIPSVKECIQTIENALHEKVMSIEVDSLHNTLSNSNNKGVYSNAIDRINTLRNMSESDVRKNMPTELGSFKVWVPQIKTLLEKLNVIEGITEEVDNSLSSRFKLKNRISTLSEKVSSIETENSKFVSNNIKAICEKYSNKLYGNKDAISESAIAFNFISELAPFNWLEIVKESIESIVSFANENFMSFEVDSVLKKLQSNKSTNMYATAIDTLSEIKNLSESEIRESIKYKINGLNWVPEVKYLIEKLNTIENNLSDNTEASIVRKYSPIVENSNGVCFYLSGTTYAINENELVPINPYDLGALYLTLIAVTENFTFGTGRMTYYKGNNVVEFSLNESGSADFKFNGKVVDIKESNDIRNFLLSNGSFRISDTSELDMVTKAYENINSFVELDFVSSINSRQYKDLTVNAIRLGENVYINRINPSSGVNEMIKTTSAIEAIDLVKEYINYDIKSKITDLLEGELKESAILEEKRNQLFDRIQFLKEQRSKISETGVINEGLKSADNLLVSEISKYEKELNNVISKSK